MTRIIKKRNLVILTSTVVTAGVLAFAFSSFLGSDKNVQPEISTASGPAALEQQVTIETPANDPAPPQSLSVEQTDSVSTANNQYAVVDQGTATFQTASGATYPLRTYKPLLVNDPVGQQWWTDSTSLDTAWDIGSGPRQTVVAVIDTGFALQHEEFTNRWSNNSDEQGLTASEASSKLNCTDRGLPLDKSCNLIDDNFDGIVDNETGATTKENPSQLNCTDRGLPLDKSCNLIDDDSNGYVDDVTGWDFINFDASVQAGQTNPSGDGTQHGTAVTGILAATGNNNKGIAGVDWSTKILPLQALDDDSYGNTLTIARAVYYAADRGVDVINLSLGSESEDSYLRQAIHYALDRDVIVVAASGNDGCDCISYPAIYPEVIAVGAQNQEGTPATFSNYGSALDILAPGASMTTPSWSEAFPSTGYITGAGGTSLAAPYVSGLFSLALSHQPTAQWGEIVNILLATSDHDTLTKANPFSNQIGSGYAQADTFITRLTTSNQPGMRYTFRPTPTTSTLSSSLSYQCTSASDFPTAPFYEVTSGKYTFYTIDAMERSRAIDRGDIVVYLGRVCVGLPTDTPSTTRLINLLGEIKNLRNYKGW